MHLLVRTQQAEAAVLGWIPKLGFVPKAKQRTTQSFITITTKGDITLEEQDEGETKAHLPPPGQPLVTFLYAKALKGLPQPRGDE